MITENLYISIRRVYAGCINTIPEFIFAEYANPKIPQTDAVEKLREAARSIYKINDYELMRRWYFR